MTPIKLLSSPLGKIRDTALGALTDPKAAAGTVLHHAKGAVGVGRSVVGTVASEVVARVPGLPDPNLAESEDVGRQAGGPVASAAPEKPTEMEAPAADVPRAVKRTTGAPPAKKSPAKRAAAKKAPSKKAAVTDPMLRDGAQDEVVYTTETPEPRPGDHP